MNRNYSSLLPCVLNALYPDEKERRRVKEILTSYGKASFHQEQARVQLGILKLASVEPEKLEAFTQLACEDFRDLLCAAEYPLTSRCYGLRDKDPEKYIRLEQKEITEYDQWLSKILSA